MVWNRDNGKTYFMAAAVGILLLLISVNLQKNIYSQPASTEKPDTPEGFVTYNNTFPTFEIKYPSDWSLIDHYQELVYPFVKIIEICCPEKPGVNGTMWIYAARESVADPARSLECPNCFFQIVHSLNNDLLDAEIKVLENATTTLFGIPAQKVVGSNPSRDTDNNMSSRILIWTNLNASTTLPGLNYTVSNDNYLIQAQGNQQAMTTLQQMIDSLVIGNQTET